MTTPAFQEFRDSVTPILLAQNDFIDWKAVRSAVSESATATSVLQALCDSGKIDADSLASAFVDVPRVYEVALSLIGFISTGSQTSKWGLPEQIPESEAGRKHLASQLLHIGLGKVLSGRTEVEGLLRVAEVYKDSFRRRFRSGEKVETIANKIVREAIDAINLERPKPLRLSFSNLPDPQLRRSLEHVIFDGERPIIGISIVFQNQSGGRQQRDLSTTYPALQNRMLEYGMDLVLIADGQGIKEASDRALEELFSAVRYPMTLKQAEGGALAKAISESIKRPPPESLDSSAISRLIAEALNAGNSVSVSDLPLSHGPAIMALAKYIEGHRHLHLELKNAGAELAWSKPEVVSEARAVAQIFDPERAIASFSRLVGSLESEFDAEGQLHKSIIRTPDTPPFTGKALVVADARGLTSEVIRSMGRNALELTPGSSFAFLLTKQDMSAHEVAAFRKRQALLPVNIVVIGPGLLGRMSRVRDPIGLVTDAILNQSDLTKVSPFILSNATPGRMFYGREVEASTILATVGTNSVALLGSRRIGKSSLLRRVRQELAEANYLPFFGDCQTVRTWNDFAAMASTEWGVESPSEFRPPHLSGLIRSLARGSDKPVVILLDEIDQLLEWDVSHAGNSVPEAFFRTCRSLSQDGIAQFVFSGERTIAQRIWDPHSPHWNFCRPIELAQLTREAATSLLLEPLKAMNIHISEEHFFAQEAWRRTSGHPQIVQYLGDRLVRLLDSDSDRTKLNLGPNDLEEVADSYDFAEHYLNTYWGQATSFEREVTLQIVDHPVSIDELLDKLRERHPGLEEIYLQSAIRMLKLYGIIEEKEGTIGLRAFWFRNALSYFGAQGRR